MVGIIAYIAGLKDEFDQRVVVEGKAGTSHLQIVR
jgi:hypothetical protein